MRVNERNIANVMGKINKFLSKDTKEYVGIRKVKVGVDEINVDGKIHHIPVYEDRKFYVPFIGNCDFHNIRKSVKKDLKDRNPISSIEMKMYNSVALSLNDKYSMQCIPINIGDEVLITGNKMIIRDTDNFRVKSKTYRLFYHAEITDTEREDKIKSGITEVFCKKLSYKYNNDNGDINDCYYNIISLSKNIIDSIDINTETVDEVIFDNIIFHINIAAFIDGIPEKIGIDYMYYKYNDKKYYEIREVAEDYCADH